jgi:hypothetical protein
VSPVGVGYGLSRPHPPKELRSISLHMVEPGTSIALAAH